MEIGYGSPSTIINTSNIEKTQLDSISYLDDKNILTFLMKFKVLSSVVIIQSSLEGKLSK